MLFRDFSSLFEFCTVKPSVGSILLHHKRDQALLSFGEKVCYMFEQKLLLANRKCCLLLWKFYKFIWILLCNILNNVLIVYLFLSCFSGHVKSVCTKTQVWENLCLLIQDKVSLNKLIEYSGIIITHAIEESIPQASPKMWDACLAESLRYHQ